MLYHECAVLVPISRHMSRSWLRRMTELRQLRRQRLRRCADNETLFAALEQLLGLDDTTLKHQPFDILPLRELDWRGRETLLVQSLVRDVPRLREVLLNHSMFSQPLARRSIDLTMMQPVIALVEMMFDDQKLWWNLYRLGIIVAHLGNEQVQAFCLDALVHGSSRLRLWVKQHYLSQAVNLTSDALDDDMIAALLADLNGAQPDLRALGTTRWGILRPTGCTGATASAGPRCFDHIPQKSSARPQACRRSPRQAVSAADLTLLVQPACAAA